MKNISITAVLLALYGPLAGAQTATSEIETVTVEGQKVIVDDTARHFVQSFAKPAPAGTIALWRDKICPKAVGLMPAFDVFVAARVRAIADQAGAPVDHDDPCQTNIEIVFTLQPQATLDLLRNESRKAGRLLLGYDNETKVHHPVQAWYGTVTRDDNGQKMMDDPWEDLRWTASRGTRLYTGITAELGTALIIVDTGWAQGQSLGAVSDYIALLALSQSSQFNKCQPVPTIINLMAADCAIKTAGLTDIDRGFLKGLYASDTGGPELLQQGRIIKGMKKDMAQH